MAEILNNSTLGCSEREQVSAFFNGKTFRFTTHEVNLNFLQLITMLSPKKLFIVMKLNQDPPWVVFRRSQNGSIVEYTGICFEIINTLRNFYNFTQENAPTIFKI